MATKEKQKDAILQKVMDILEHENWGGNDESLVLELVFDRELSCRFFLRKKFKKMLDKIENIC
jgi:hypothetical protein